MKIVDVTWTPRVNVLTLECDKCRRWFRHPVTQWVAVCPLCKRIMGIEAIRRKYVDGKRASGLSLQLRKGEAKKKSVNKGNID